MNTRTDHDPPPRSFGVRAAALAGLIVALGVPAAGAAGAFDAETGLVIADDPGPNPSTCCGRDT